MSLVSEPHLISRSDDKHPTQDEALAVRVALITRSPGSDEVLPHTEAKEPEKAHLSLQWTVEEFLQTHLKYLMDAGNK